MYRVQHIEQLPFVLVYAFHLHVEQHFGGDVEVSFLFDIFRESQLVGEFYCPPLLPKFLIIGEWCQPPQFS
jgi:hypothetical protein